MARVPPAASNATPKHGKASVIMISLYFNANDGAGPARRFPIASSELGETVDRRRTTPSRYRKSPWAASSTMRTSQICARPHDDILGIELSAPQYRFFPVAHDARTTLRSQ